MTFRCTRGVIRWAIYSIPPTQKSRASGNVRLLLWWGSPSWGSHRLPRGTLFLQEVHRSIGASCRWSGSWQSAVFNRRLQIALRSECHRKVCVCQDFLFNPHSLPTGGTGGSPIGEPRLMPLLPLRLRHWRCSSSSVQVPQSHMSEGNLQVNLLTRNAS